ncbi:hypothetical protein PCAR4_150056 [Paraburkholderia caribensis]|nr:hypothetical protein PCAR4_150056 [Paraburkholderia caribensis]
MSHSPTNVKTGPGQSRRVIADSGFQQRWTHFRRALDAGQRGQIDQHPLDNRCLRQDRSEETGGHAVFYKNCGEILNVKIVETVGVSLDIDPCEADIRMPFRERVERDAVLAAGPAPFRAQTRNEKRLAISDELSDPFRVGVQVQRGHGGFLRYCMGYLARM